MRTIVGMKEVLKFVSLLCLILGGISSHAYATNFTWQGTTNEWVFGFNWDQGFRPSGSTDDALFTGNGTGTVSILFDVNPGRSIQFSGTQAYTFSSGGGKFTFLGTSSNDAIINSSTAAQTFNNDITLSSSASTRIFNANTADLSFTGAMVMDTDLTVKGSNDTTVSGVASGAGDLRKEGTGTLTLSGSSANTYTGDTTVTAGTLTLSKTAGTDAIAGGTITLSGGTLSLGAANQIDNTADMDLAGGTFKPGGNNETLGDLTLSANSNIDFDSTASVITFASLDSFDDNFTLTIDDWLGGTNPYHGGGPNQIIFTDASAWDADSLAQVTFTGYGAGAFIIGSTGELVPAPEPSTIVSGIFIVVSGLVYEWKRRKILAEAN